MLKGCSCFVGNLLVIHSGKVIHLFSTLFAQVMNKLFTHCFFSVVPFPDGSLPKNLVFFLTFP